MENSLLIRFICFFCFSFVWMSSIYSLYCGTAHGSNANQCDYEAMSGHTVAALPSVGYIFCSRIYRFLCCWEENSFSSAHTHEHTRCVQYIQWFTVVEHFEISLEDDHRWSKTWGVHEDSQWLILFYIFCDGHQDSVECYACLFGVRNQRVSGATSQLDEKIESNHCLFHSYMCHPCLA